MSTSVQAGRFSLREQGDLRVLALLETCIRQAGFVLLTMLAVLFVTGTDVFLGGRGLLPVPPTVLFAIFGGLICGVALLQAWLNPGEWVARFQALSTHCRWPLIFVFALAAISLLGSLADGADWSSLGMNIFLPVVSSVAVVLGIGIGFIFPPAWLRVVVWLALIAAVGSMVVDLVTPGAFSTVISRAAGFAENANYAAYIVLIHCIVLLRWRSFSMKDGAVLIFAAMGVLVTVSRSGLLLMMVVIAAYIALALLLPADPSKVRRNAIAAALALGFGVGAAVVVITTSGVFEASSSANRITSMFGGGGAFVETDDERLVVLREYSAAIEEHPLLGHGTAYTKTKRVGPHNMYVLQWVNNGVPGLVAYVGLLLSLAACCRRVWRVEGLMLMAIIGLAGFFSHDLLDQRPFTLVMGMLIARIALDHRHSVTCSGAPAAQS